MSFFNEDNTPEQIPLYAHPDGALHLDPPQSLWPKFRVGQRVYYPVSTYRYDHDISGKSMRELMDRVVPEHPLEFKDGRIKAILPNCYYLISEYNYPGHTGETRHEDQLFPVPHSNRFWGWLFR